MPDDLYDRDILAWSEQQAALLRRVARGEQLNAVDWDHVVEEIEDVGLSELSAVHRYLRQLLLHLMKLHGWLGCSAREHWRNEIVVFQAEAADRFAPSMRQRLDVAPLYQQAGRLLRRMRVDGQPPVPPNPDCPFALDDLLSGDTDELVKRLATAGEIGEGR